MAGQPTLAVHISLTLRPKSVYSNLAEELLITVRPPKGWPAVQVAEERGEMTAERVLPEDPLAFIQRCVQRRQLSWTYHINMRLQGRFISRQHILDAVDTYEVIE